MNRIVAEGLLTEAARGSRIVVITHNQSAAHQALSEVAVRAREFETKRIAYANGGEHIETVAGGSIRFISAQGHGGRGLTADMVFVDGESADRALGLVGYANITAMLNSAIAPEIIRA